MTTKKNPGLGARQGSIDAALSVRSVRDESLPSPDADRVIALSVRLPAEMYSALLDITSAAKKRGDKTEEGRAVSIHSLMLEGIAKVIAEKKV